MAGPYFDELVQALGPEDATGTSRVAEDASAATTERLRGLVELVRASLNESGAAEALLRDAVGRLQQLGADYDDVAMETAAETTYGRAGGIRADVELLLAHEAAPEATARLLDIQAYVRRAAVPELNPDVDEHELAIDRRLLLQRLSPALAVDAPHQIDEVEAGFDIFRRRYVELYVRRHRAYHDMMSTWRREFTSENATRLNALRLLNEIPALGAPVGSDLELRARRILSGVLRCEMSDAQVREALLHEPRCPICDLDLMASPPSAEVAQWHDDCLAALRLQQRRLARAAVALAAARGQEPAIERFLRVAQAIDVLPLIDVMDETVQGLIRELLSDE